MARKNSQDMPATEEGLCLRLYQYAEEERLKQILKASKSAAATPPSPQRGTSRTHQHGAHGLVPSGPSTSAQASTSTAGSVLPRSEPVPGPSTSTHASTSAAGSVLPRSEPVPGPSTSAQASTSAAGSVLPQSKSVPGPSTSAHASTSAPGSVLPRSEPVPGPSTSAHASTSTAGSVLPLNEPVPGPSTSAHASTSAESVSSSASPKDPVVKKYDRDTELATVFRLRTILNEIRHKVVKVQDIIFMLQSQLEVRKVPSQVPREYEYEKAIPKL